MKLNILLATATLLNSLLLTTLVNAKDYNFNLTNSNTQNPLYLKNQYISQANQTEVLWLKHSPEINSLIKESILYQKSKKYEQALASLQKALQLAQQDKFILGQWQVYAFQALTYKQMGDAQKSIAINEQNLEFIGQISPETAKQQFADLPGLEAQTLDAIGGNYSSLGDYSKAIELLRKAINALNKRKDPIYDSVDIIEAHLLMKLGVNLFLAGNIAESEKNLFAALAEYEKKINFRIKAGSSVVDEYEFPVEILRWLPQVLAAQNKTNRALELAELGRARAFTLLLKKRLGQEGNLQQQAETLSIEQIKQIAKAQNSTLVQYTVTYDYNPDAFLLSNFQDISASGLLIWIIKPTGEISFRKVKIDKDKPLAALVQSARKAINARTRGGVNKTVELQQLHNLLIEPIADLLPTNPNTRVTFIPQDLLFLVPFPALQDSNGKYLIEKHTILTAPAIGVLGFSYQQQQRLQDTIKGVLVVGNPTMPSLSTVEGKPPQPMPSLPGAEEEAKAIAQVFQTEAITGGNATKANVIPQMSQARIIHIATHGLLDDVGGVFSSLAFAPSGQDTGFLTAREIISLKLNAELVVLSACNTGRGKITGDGVVGLSRAFIGAGVPSVIVSLWAVPDAPTAALMTDFYQQLKGNADKAQALRQAMLITMKQFPNPVNWAAFTLIGSGDASTTLKTATGKRAINASNNTQTNQSTYYTVFPVPPHVKNYREFPSPLVKDEISIVYSSNLTSAAIINFYRQAFSQQNLTEDKALTMLDNQQWQQLVFNGLPNSKKIVIQINEEPGNNMRSVSVRFE